MNKTGVVGVIAAALLLSGCASGPSAAPVEETISSPVAEAPAETAAPLTASTPTPEATEDDTAYLAEVRLRITGLPEATDEQLIASGHEACDRLAAGEAKEQIQLIDGEQQSTTFNIYADSYAITTWAAKTYCPEFDS